MDSLDDSYLLTKTPSRDHSVPSAQAPTRGPSVLWWRCAPQSQETLQVVPPALDRENPASLGDTVILILSTLCSLQIQEAELQQQALRLL